MAAPAMTFSDTDCSTKPAGAMTFTAPESMSACKTIARAPPKWSVWLWV